MINKDVYKRIITPEKETSSLTLYRAPLIPLVLWMVFSLVSLATVSTDVLLDPFVIISILSRLIVPVLGVKLIKKFYYEKKLSTVSYNHYLHVVGYGIVFTYIFFIFPQVVIDFHNYGESSLIFVLAVVFCTLCPLVLFLLLKNPKTKMALGFFTQKEVDKERECKKNKKMMKAEKKKLKKKRSLAQNIWFEWIDPILGAILWVSFINHFLFQLYMIPTSSMVPEFYKKDRVIVSKFLSGPSVPLTKYNLPDFANPESGDIVTFVSPEVHNPDSELYYNNVFTRVFQPFFYMLTFSRVDIDAKDNGDPKPRQLVKRVIAVPGEKICMVNDKVYKKTKDSDWTLMSEIPGEKEWGQNALFSLNSPKTGFQLIRPQIRKELDEAAAMAMDITTLELEKELALARELLLDNWKSRDRDKLIQDLRAYGQDLNNLFTSDFYDGLYNLHQITGHFNEVSLPPNFVYSEYFAKVFASEQEKTQILNNFNFHLEKYRLYHFRDQLAVYRSLLLEDTVEFSTEVIISEDASPYDEFTAKLNAVITLKNIQLLNILFADENILSGSLANRGDVRKLTSDLKKIQLYVKGFPIVDGFYVSFYGSGNLPEYPAGEGNYIAEKEYFLVGDNRYNSKDSRMGDITRYEFLDSQNPNVFTPKFEADWEPHGIHKKYIHGKVRAIFFPFNRIKIFF